MSARFDVLDTTLDGLKILQRMPIGDARGYLERLYCAADLHELLGDRRIEQINRTYTQKRGTVRGLHYQVAPHAETKFVTCLRGEVYDVAVLRQRVGFLLEELGLTHPHVQEWPARAQRGGSSKLLGTAPYVNTYSERWSLSINAPLTSLHSASA